MGLIAFLSGATAVCSLAFGGVNVVTVVAGIVFLISFLYVCWRVAEIGDFVGGLAETFLEFPFFFGGDGGGSDGGWFDGGDD